MASYPPFDKFYVVSYAANDRDHPVIGIKKDPRVAGYRIPEDLSPHPDSKRYPNHVFTGAQPSSGDQIVTHIYEILPAPWVPFTRYDDDLGPIQGRRRSVKNEGQVASLAADKRVTYEAREGSAIVYTEIEEAWSIETDEGGNSLFPIRDRDFYDASRGPVQERRQLFVPTGEEAGSLENVNGVITQTSYEPYNEFLSVKIVQTYSVDGPQLVGRAIDNDGQLVTITTQRKGADGYIPPNPTATRAVEVSREDAESLVERIVDTPEIFTAQTFSVERPDPIPQKFRVAVPIQSKQEVVEGSAELPTLLAGEISRTEEQRNKFIKRTTATSRDQSVLPKILIQRGTDNDRQPITITETLQLGDTNETTSATVTIQSEALGDGNYVISKTEIPEIFNREALRQIREDNTPAKFRAGLSRSVSESNVVGVAEKPQLEIGDIEKSEEQINKFVKRVSTTKSPSISGVRSISIKSSGEGYVQETTRVTIIPKDSKGSGAEAIAVIQDGKVVGINILESGSGYVDGTTATVSCDPPETVGAEVVVNIGLTIVEKELSQTGQIVTTVSKIESDPIVEENPYTVRASFEQTNPNEFLSIKSVSPIFPSPSFTHRSPEEIPNALKAVHGERIIESETAGNIKLDASLSPVFGLTEITQQQTSLGRVRSQSRFYGEYSGAITGCLIASGGENYSNNTVIEIVAPTGLGASLKPIIFEGEVTGVEVLSGGAGYFEGASLEIIDLEGFGSGASIRLRPQDVDFPSGPEAIEAIEEGISLETQQLLNEFKQKAIITETVRGIPLDGEEEGSTALVEFTQKNLGDGRYLITKTEIPEIFAGESFSIERPDPVPQKFRVAVPTKTTQLTEEGEAEMPSISGNQIAKSVQQITKFTKRTSTTQRDNVTSQVLEGEVYTSELGGGMATVTESYGSDPVIDPKLGTISATKENLGNDQFVTTQIDLETPLPILKGQDYEDALDVAIPYTRQFVEAGTELPLSPANIDPRDTLHSVVTEFDATEARERLLDVLYVTGSIQSVSLPNVLTSVKLYVDYATESAQSDATGNSATASTTVGVNAGVDLLYDIKDGYQGPADAEQYLFFLPKEQCGLADILSKSNGAKKFPVVLPKTEKVLIRYTTEKKFVSLQASLPNNRSISQSIDRTPQTKTFTIPPTLHSGIGIQTVIVGASSISTSIGIETPTQGSYGVTIDATAELQETQSTLTATTPTSFPAGRYLYSVTTSPYRFGLVRVEAIVVKITEAMVS